MEYKIII